jgi:hypothetical protein
VCMGVSVAMGVACVLSWFARCRTAYNLEFTSRSSRGLRTHEYKLLQSASR